MRAARFVVVVIFLIGASHGQLNVPCVTLDDDTRQDLNAFIEDPSPMKEKAHSSVCMDKDGSFHEYVSIWKPSTKVRHCADMPFTVRAAPKERHRRDFVEAGCAAVEEHALESYFVLDCVKRKMTRYFNSVFKSSILQDSRVSKTKLRLRKTLKTLPDSISFQIEQTYRAFHRPYLAKAAMISLIEADRTESDLGVALEHFVATVKKHYSSGKSSVESFVKKWVAKTRESRDWHEAWDHALFDMFRDMPYEKPSVLHSCFLGHQELMALKCNPVMSQSTGYMPPLEEEPTSIDTVCGDAKVASNGLIKAHPVMIRMAIDTLAEYFQPRFYSKPKGIKKYLRMRGKILTKKKSKQLTYLPSECTNVHQKGVCWMFSRCVKQLAKRLQYEHTHAINPMMVVETTEESDPDSGMDQMIVNTTEESDSDSRVNQIQLVSSEQSE